MTIKYVVLEIIDQFKATDQGQTMEIVRVYTRVIREKNAS